MIQAFAGAEQADHGATDSVREGSVTVNEAMRLTGLGRTYLYQLMERGELRYAKVGKRRLVLRTSLADLLRRNVVGG